MAEKPGVRKFMVDKSGVEKSRVQMSFKLENYFFKFETRSRSMYSNSVRSDPIQNTFFFVTGNFYSQLEEIIGK